MLINSKEELNKLLNYCKATPYSLPKEGGKFYKIKSQEFKFPDNSIQTREYIDKKKASVVVPITDEGNLIFIIQPIALSTEGALIEFPAGYWEFNENGIEAGIRELAEETGYVPEEIISLGDHYQDPGSIKQKVDTFLALGCQKLNNQKLNNQKLDKGEFIIQIEIPFELALELMDDNYFKDANTFIALTKGYRFIKKNDKKIPKKKIYIK